MTEERSDGPFVSRGDGDDAQTAARDDAARAAGVGKKCALFANTDWYLYNFRLSLARSLRAQGYSLLLLSPPGPYGEKLREMGFAWVPVPMRRASLNPLRELRLLLWLIRRLRVEQVDLIHGFTIKCAVYGALAARFAGAASIGAVTGMGFVFTGDAPKARLLRPGLRALMALCFRGPHATLVVQNRDDFAFFRDQRIARRGGLHLIPGSGVDCARFVPPVDSARPRGRGATRVVLAARLLSDKGVFEYVEAARLLKAQGRKIEFVLAGLPDAGNPAAIDEELAQGWHEAGLVNWLRHVDDTPQLFARADIVVLPSYREGLPKSMIEAAACARPLVTTDAPGCREVATHEVDGLLVPPRDAAALAAAIARLDDDPALAAQLGAAARRKALACFDEAIINRETGRLYAAALAQAE